MRPAYPQHNLFRVAKGLESCQMPSEMSKDFRVASRFVLMGIRGLLTGVLYGKKARKMIESLRSIQLSLPAPYHPAYPQPPLMGPKNHQSFTSQHP